MQAARVGAVATPARRARRRLRGGLVWEVVRRPLGALSLALVVGISLASIFAPFLTRYPPESMYASFVLSPPNMLFWLGTDDFGRDIMSRILYGGQISLRVGVGAVLLGVSSGTLIGLVTGYKGGRLDLAMQRLMDSLMAFPTLVLALALVAMLGISLQNIILAISIVLIPTSSRIIRSVTMAVKHEQYIEAARVSGCTDLRILARHICPNIFATVLVLTTANLGAAIVTEAALSFVGLGTPPPTPSWGQMMTGSARTYLVTAPWMAFFPGLTLSLLVLGINLLGDTLRDVLDPRLRRR